MYIEYISINLVLFAEPGIPQRNVIKGKKKKERKEKKKEKEKDTEKQTNIEETCHQNI